MLLAVVVLSVFLIALTAPWLQRQAHTGGVWLLALGPAGLCIWFLSQARPILSGTVIEAVYPWVPSLGVAFALQLDGLSLLFALLISGIGALVILYSGYYLADHPDQGRFQGYTLLFMGAMLGLVLADDVITLFVFWELTSVTSYLLIGFHHEDERARYGALKALLITGAGGLALLLGLILLGQAGGSFRLSELLAQGQTLPAHALYVPITLLVLAGAFTKSAQVPFHIWLPDAMQAPTPASAYLHSATMVKAGIYLLARLNPALGGTNLWHLIVSLTGLTTMLVGAYLAFKQTDLKALLAYSTISALEMLVTLIGLGTSLTLKAAMVGILAHALYKGTLFLVVGAVDHSAGTRDLRRLGGLARAMPVTAVLATVAAFSMAGIPPLFGFLAKETFLEAMLLSTSDVLPIWPGLVIAVLVTVLTVGYSLLLVHGVFLGPSQTTPKTPHEAPWGVLLAPGLMAALSLVLALPPASNLAAALLASASGVALGNTVDLKLKLWHGINLPLLISASAVASGGLLYALRQPFWRWQAGWPSRLQLAPLYDGGLVALNHLVLGLTRLLQTGALRHYLLMILGSLLGLVGYALLATAELAWPAWPAPYVPAYELVLAGLMIIAALSVVVSPSRLGAIAALGTVGYMMALFFVLYSGPDLALTQLLVETLTVILLLLVFYFLPRFFEERSPRPSRWRDALIATGVGVLVTVLVLMVVPLEFAPSISGYYLENSRPAGFGTNVVNVILVDFRALDTLGEITVLVIAALSAYGLIKLRPQVEENLEEQECSH